MNHHHHHHHKKPLLPSLFHELDLIRDFFDWDEDFYKFENSSISLYETDHDVIVEAAMPGCRPEDIQISFDRGILWMRAESKTEKKDVKYHMKASSNYSYRLPIPTPINENVKPEATYENGILKVTFEKSQGSKAQKIEVKTK